MELGGNAPFLVLEGGLDVDSAVEGGDGGEDAQRWPGMHSGQSVLYSRVPADEFATKFEAALRGLKIGPGVDQSNDLGAMVSVKERDKILEFVQAAESEGTTPTAMAGDAPSDGAFIAPYIVRGVEHGSTLTRNEIFGPVAPIVTFEDPADGIRMANDTEYGLIAVFAKDAGEGIKVQAGRWNPGWSLSTAASPDPAAPFGGMKESGLGRGRRLRRIHEFLETQYFASTSSPFYGV